MSIKFMKINKFEPAADEKRLEELAAKGEFIKRHLWFLAFFRKGEPKKVKYCIEASMFRPSRKVRKAYAESGWKLTARGEDFSVFMSEEENAVPLHTDRSEYAHVVKKYHRHSLAMLIYLYLFALLYIFMPVIFFPLITFGECQVIFTLPLMYGLQKEFLKISIWYAVILFPVLLVSLREFIKAGQFVTGCIENKSDAERAVRRNNIMTGVFVFLLIVDAAVILFYAYASLDNTSEDVPFSQLPDSIVTIDEIYTENIEFLLTDEAAEKYIDPELWEHGIKAYTPSAYSVTSVFTDCHYHYWQHAAYIPDGKEKGRKISLHNTYTEFKNEWLAEKGADEFMQYEYYFFSDKPDKVQLDTEGTPFDKAEYLLTNYSLYMVLQAGDTVHTINTTIPPESGFTPEMIFEQLCR
ncbi:MAG: DUF2812 domain-containing protein [Oscillospiraceae bacterium]|nr:DUF2812 domain-containing protein [Oscillospiraceae bacterium]